MTARLLQRLPIRHKLVAMLMLTSTIVLLLASIGYLANDYYRTRDDLISDFRTQVDLVIENSGGLPLRGKRQPLRPLRGSSRGESLPADRAARR
jgi:hypothetical protein